MVYGTEDVSAWYFATSVLEQGKNPYTQSYLFNWSPFWLYFIYPIFKISNIFKIPFYGLIKIIPILCDAVISITIYNIFLQLNHTKKKALLASFFYALNPISIIITSIHGNFVSIPTSFLIVSIYLLYYYKNKHSIKYSAIALGIAVMSKIWPILFLPILLQKIKTLKNRLTYILLSILPTLVTLLPMYFIDKDIVINKFLKYESIPNWWGFTGLDKIWNSEHLGLFSYFYAKNGAVILGIILLLLYLTKTFKMNLFKGCALISLSFLFFAAGFGPQYLVWILPFAIIARDKMLFPFTFLVTVIFIIEYGFRPFLGGFGTYVSMNPTALTLEQFIRDNKITNILRLPLWLFIGFWLGKILFLPKAVRETNDV